MTKKLEEFFNISSEDIDDSIEDSTVTDTPVVDHPKTKKELFAEASEIYTSLSTVEKIDHALPTVVGLEGHDTEMDDIANRALKTFEDLVSIGGNVADVNAGKIYEVAGQMLKTALDARNYKADRKLKMIELQLKKARIEQTSSDPDGKKTNAIEFDRNEILKALVSSKTSTS